MLRPFRLAFLPLALLCLAAPAAAQLTSTPRATGFAGAYLALARGSEAVDWNPANLGLPGQPRWSFALPRLGVAGAVLGPPLGELPTLVRDDLTDADRLAFLDQVPEAGISFRAGALVPWAGLSVGRFAVSVSSTALLDAHTGREMVDLYLETRQYGGVDPARLDEYRVGNTGFGTALLTSAAVAYAHPIPLFPFPASVGVAGRATFVHEALRARIFDPVPNWEESDIEMTMVSLRASGGRGFGLDVGAAAQPLPGLTVGLAVENLAQSMSWDGGLEQRGGVFSGRELALMEPPDFVDLFDPQPYDSAEASPQVDSIAAALLSGAAPPRVLRAGAALQAGGTAVSLTWTMTTGDGRLFAGWPQQLAVGVEQRLFGFWSLRGGAASSLSGATALALGTSFAMGALQLTLAATRVSGNDEPRPESAADFDFPGRLVATSGYGLMLGLDITGAPPPARRSRRSR
ncbi:MAG TPA: hypothetical protein VF192_01665 [Longimicrobiales bacterium]